jgi:hypothetical protein
MYLNHKAKKDYIFRKLRIIKISPTLSGLNDCLHLSKTWPDALKICPDVTELAGTSNRDFANKENWGKVKECLFYHSKIVSSFENKFFLIM